MGDVPDKDADLKLLQRVIDAESGAWNAFFARYHRLIIACIRKVHSRYGAPCPAEDIEDLVNVVCLQLIRDDFHKLRRFDATRGYRLSSWVGLIATNAAHDALRRRGPSTVPIDQPEGGWVEQAADQPSPADLALLKERQAKLNQAVGHLTDSEQAFLRYYYLEQRQPDEIAELLGISINTVYSRKNKVRASLKKIVDQLEQQSC